MKKIKFINFLALLLLIGGCATKQHTFPQEDSYILKSLVYENDGEYKKAAKIYKFLYEKTGSDVYFEKYVQMLFLNKEYKKVIKIADEFLKDKFDKEVFKYKIFSLVELKKLQDAKNELLEKFNKKDEFFYIMMSYILMKEKKYNEALYYSRSLYALKPTQKNLLNLVDNLIKMKKYNEALAYLQTHMREYGCEYKVCLRLANIYKEMYDIQNLAAIYERLGKFDKKYYILALNLYVENKNYKKAINLVKEHHLSEEYLMYIYEQMKDYKDASLMALNLYLRTKEIKYFLKYTIYLYNLAPNDKKNLKVVVNNLKEISKKVDSPFVNNFLGYLLIEKDINPKEGLKYVEKAVNADPTNEAYIDSLAWGYYKLKECKKAYEIITQIDTDDNTILEHKKLIKRCLNDTAKNHKKNKRGFRKKKKSK